MTRQSDIADSLTEVAREISTQLDLGSTLDAIVRVAERSLARMDLVGISVVHRDGTIETMAGTGQVVWELDSLQYELHEGRAMTPSSGRR